MLKDGHQKQKDIIVNSFRGTIGEINKNFIIFVKILSHDLVKKVKQSEGWHIVLSEKYQKQKKSKHWICS